MEPAKQELLHLYGNRLRTRVCGLCISDGRLLMVRHKAVGPDNLFWSPPGGGMAFGESAPEALVREFYEESGLSIEIGVMLFVNEYIQPPLHAIELFFSVEWLSGSLATGLDPEFSVENQIIQDVRFMTFGEIKALPEANVHRIFKNCDTLEDLLSIRGYVRG